MKSGMLKHPYLGETRVYNANNRQLLEVKVSEERNQGWFKMFSDYRDFEWKYCLFPTEVADEEDHQFNSPIPRKYSIKKVAPVFMLDNLQRLLRDIA